MIEIGNTVRLKSNEHKMTVSYVLYEVVWNGAKNKNEDKISYQCIFLNSVTGTYSAQYFPEGVIVKDGK